MPPSSHNGSRPVTQYQRLAASLVVRSRQLLEDGPTMLPYDMPAMYRIWCVIAEGIGSKAAYGLAVSDELRPFHEVLSLADAYFEVEWGGSFTVPPFNLIGSNASPFAENIFWDVDGPRSRSLSIQSSAALPRENNTIGREPLFSYLSPISTRANSPTPSLARYPSVDPTPFDIESKASSETHDASHDFAHASGSTERSRCITPSRSHLPRNSAWSITLSPRWSTTMHDINVGVQHVEGDGMDL